MYGHWCEIVFVRKKSARDGFNTLPIFLFNYTDRTMHSVYKAVGPRGQSLKRDAWAVGVEDTPFPSQVGTQPTYPTFSINCLSTGGPREWGKMAALHGYKWGVLLNIM